MWENFSFFPCQRVSKSWASFFISRYPIFLVSLKYLPPSSPLYLSFPFPLYHLISSGILSSKWLCSFLNLNTSSWIGVLTDQNMTLQSYRQASVEKETNSGKAVISAQEAEDLKMKEKRKREHEVLIILNLRLFVNLIILDENFYLMYNMTNVLKLVYIE